MPDTQDHELVQNHLPTAMKRRGRKIQQIYPRNDTLLRQRQTKGMVSV